MSKPKTRGQPEKGARLGTSVRLDEDTKARLEAIAVRDEAATGYRPAVADVLRGCLRLGIEVRERELRKEGKR
jgi:hypothetical protein